MRSLPSTEVHPQRGKSRGSEISSKGTEAVILSMPLTSGGVPGPGNLLGLGLYVPQIHMGGTQNVTVFRNRVVADLMNEDKVILRWGGPGIP